MSNSRNILALCSALSTLPAAAAAETAGNGLIEDSHLNVFLRNAYFNRDYTHGRQDKAEWGQSAIARFSSGFTQGPVGFGLDAFAQYAVRLDGGRGRSGAPGIDFFKQGDSGEAAHEVSRIGGAVKIRLSKSEIRYGEQHPFLPVLFADGGAGNGTFGRLLPESYTGTSFVSRELEGLQLDGGHFTEYARKSAASSDSARLGAIDVLGGRYAFSEHLSGAYYASDVKDTLTKQYINLNAVLALAPLQSLTLDFNGYKTLLEPDYALGFSGDSSARNNKIWSLSATYQCGPHRFILAYQRNTGEIGYPYTGYPAQGGVGDGGGTIFLANSFWSDFNAKDERSWQLGYGTDFSTFGLPGLNYRFAYVLGDHIDAGQGRGEEREIFNQLQYVVQSGPAKDLTLRVRSSIVRTSNNIQAYNSDGNEVRAFIDFPISIF